MKKFLVAALLAMLFVSLAALMTMPSGGNAAPPAAQYGPPTNQPTGEYLNLIHGRTSFPANTAFHLNDVIRSDGKGALSKTYDVQYAVDGGPFTSADFDYKDAVGKWWVLNFPAGLSSGPHDFTIQRSGPCSAGPGPCASPKQVVILSTLTATVNFS